MADSELRADGGVEAGPRPFEEAIAPEAGDIWPIVRARRGRLIAVGVVGAVAGVVFIVVGTMVLHDSSAVTRAAVSLVGVVALGLGVDSFGKVAFGETFDTALWLSIAWFVAIALCALLADLLPLGEHENVSKTLTEPTLARPDLFSSHPLGTDRQGLDILAGVIYGARVSMVIGFVATLVGMSIGSLIGITAGYFRGRVDGLVNLLTDSMLAFPPLILLMGMVAVLEPNVPNISAALAVLGVPTYIRLSRANTMVFAQRDFVLAARALGARNRRIILRELLPNVILPIVSYGFIIVGALIVAEASLSFLGLSISRPTPTWGNMIAAGQDDFKENPHLVFIPGVVLFLTVFALNRIGDRARSMWDPRRRVL